MHVLSPKPNRKVPTAQRNSGNSSMFAASVVSPDIKHTWKAPELPKLTQMNEYTQRSHLTTP